MGEIKVLYLCDQKKCEQCHSDYCAHTLDSKHAKTSPENRRFHAESNEDYLGNSVLYLIEFEEEEYEKRGLVDRRNKEKKR